MGIQETIIYRLVLKNLDFGPYLLFSILGLKKDTPMGLRHVARGGGGGARGSAAPPPLKVVPLKKNQKMKPPCYCWQYRPQTQPIIDQATDLTVCKIGSLIVTVGLYII